jgi:8-oxo-dGTP pyrophosphatase MutT (NUDIX family)
MRAGAVILNKDKEVLLIHRFFQGREYYVIPGGGVEDGETVEEAALREIKEETCLEAKLGEKFAEFHNEFDARVNHFFLVTEFTGVPALGGPEAKRNSEEDKYILEWHSVEEIKKLALRPERIKEIIIEKLG